MVNENVLSKNECQQHSGYCGVCDDCNFSPCVEEMDYFSYMYLLNEMYELNCEMNDDYLVLTDDDFE